MTNGIDWNSFTLTIGGRGENADATLAVINPATESVVGYAPDCSKAQLDAAVAAARNAFRGWAATPLKQRADLLREISRCIAEHRQPLAALLTAEQGKPLSDALAEIDNSANWFAHFADLDLPVQQRQEPGARHAEIRRVPIGVVGAIAPWNFPVSLAVWKLAPALLAGNTVVLKPSPFTPLTTLKLGEMLSSLLPSGVLNTVSGSDRLGPWLSGHPGIDKIAFTGSTATGKAVMRSAADNLKRLTLELGGNDAAIVMPDVNVEEVATRIFWGAFRNAGQICVAAKRVYVHESIYDRFAAEMSKLARDNLPGPGDREGAKIGPVQNRLQFDRVKAMITQAREDGLRFLSEPGDMKGPGFFIAPTIIDNPPDNAQVVQEEPFGPLLPLLRFAELDEVVERANASEYGLAASVWSGDREQAIAIGRRLETGTVWINSILGISPALPFGGHKQSGIGVENAEEGLHEYTNVQAIVG